jgi:hypothetical protein
MQYNSFLMGKRKKKKEKEADSGDAYNGLTIGLDLGSRLTKNK